METDRTQVQLSNGVWVDAKVAIYDYAWLKHTSLHFPDVFYVAAESALGPAIPRPDRLSDNWADQIRTRLVDEAILDRDFGIDPTFRQVLLAGYRKRPEGSIMANPFRDDNREQVAQLRDIADEEGSGIQGLFDEEK